MVKGRVRFLAKQRGKEMKQEQMGALNKLKLKQSFLTSKIRDNCQSSLTELTKTNLKNSAGSHSQRTPNHKQLAEVNRGRRNERRGRKRKGKGKKTGNENLIMSVHTRYSKNHM